MEIEGYSLVELLSIGTKTVVHRAVQQGSTNTVILKMPVSAKPSVSIINRLLHDYNTGRELNYKGVPRYLDLIRRDGIPILVLEDIGGISLRKYCQGKALKPDQFFDIAIACTETLSYLHAKQLIHCDIKPDNIIIEPETGSIQMIDLGAATKLNNENVQVSFVQDPEFTLSYISPEQTGRMNRSVDYRSDFYSLGASFYEFLSGNPPFIYSDPSELIHAHLARVPVVPDNLDAQIPKAVVDIIFKLLAKNAEDRYQSASGILYDLNLLRNWNDHKEAPRFIPGLKDFSPVFKVTQKIFGRDEEINKLQTAFKLSHNAPAQIVMVSGYSGVGKTTLIKELYTSIHIQRGNFISGKFEQYSRLVPYKAFMNALSALLSQFLGEGDQEVNKWSKKLGNAMPSVPLVMYKLLPELRFFIPPIANGQNENEEIISELAFLESIRSLVKCVSGSGRHITLFIDDLQWADSASLKLLQSLLSDPDITNLFFIGSYRNNEGDHSHPLQIAMDQLGILKEVHQIELKPLDAQANLELVASSLLVTNEEAAGLAKIIHSKTEGNPFYINTFLESLYRSNLIFPDEKNQKWDWDIAAISSLSVSDNVAELLVQQMIRLIPEHLQILMVASCIGSDFSLEKLRWNIKGEISVIGKALRDLSRLNFIYPLSQEYKLMELAEGDEDNFIDLGQIRFKFLHDKVQQAAYSLLSENNKKEVHRTCGKQLLKQFGNNSEDTCFEIVSHLSASGNLSEEGDLEISLAKCALKAAELAKGAAAFSAAFNYCQIADDIYQKHDGWIRFQEELFALHIMQAQCAMMSQTSEKALEMVEAVFPKAIGKLQRMSAYHVKCDILTKQGRIHDVVSTAVTSFREFGVRIPTGKAAIQMGILTQIISLRTRISIMGHQKLEQLPWCTDPFYRRLINYIYNVQTSIFQSNAELHVLSVLKALNLSLKYGRAEATSHTLVSYGLALSLGLKSARSVGEYCELALRMGATGSYQERCKLDYVHSLVQFWHQSIPEGIDGLVTISAENFEIGEPVYGGYAYSQRFFLKLFNGVSLDDLLTEGEKNLSFLAQREVVAASVMLLTRYSMVMALKGKTKSPTSLSSGIFDEAAMLNMFETGSINTPLGMLLTSKIFVLLMNDKHEESLPFIHKAFKAFPYINGLISSVELSLYAVLSLSLYAQGNPDVPAGKLKKQASFFLGNLKLFASISPDNFNGVYLLAQAEWLRWKGNTKQAEEMFFQAIAELKNKGYHHYTALACELLGKMYLQKNQVHDAMLKLHDSYHNYKIWGADLRADLLKSNFPELESFIRLEKRKSQESGESGSLVTSSGNMGQALDLNSIMKAAQAISGEIVTDNLLKIMLNILHQNTGAEKACLLLTTPEGLNVRAKYDTKLESPENCDIPLQHYPELPLNIINTVYHKREVILIENASIDTRYNTDSYIARTNPVSVLCYPIIHKGDLTGIIYLENNLLSDAFSQDRLQVTELLAGQIAISLENALLYENLDRKVQERTSELFAEKKKSDELLKNILPDEVAAELKLKGSAEAKFYKNVTVLFTDFVGFTKISEDLTPTQLVAEIHEKFTAIDRIIEEEGLEKIKTIGDAYLAVCGLPVENPDHALKSIKAALRIADYINKMDGKFQIRIGLNSGPVVAGIVGVKKYAYDIWGDTVNTAARMEQASEAGKVNISASTYAIIKDQFDCEYRGKVAAKSKGEVDMYYVKEKSNATAIG